MASGLSKDEQETLRLLVQHVSRAFYEPKFTVVMDQLVRHPVLKDDDLAGRMGLQLKELNKIMATLEGHKLVRIYRQNELKEGAQRSVGRQYFYIDYQSFCNVVKWRMAEMRRIIDQGLRNELDSKGYICPQCHKSFQPLEVDRLIDFAKGTFNCDICGAELIDNENAENVVGSQDRMQRFNRQMRFILEGLRKTEDMVLPAFDVALWIKNHLAEQERAKAASRDGGLKIAGSSGDGRQGDTIGVVLSVDKDEETARQERDREAAAKRQQNALPLWHLQSTISGDLTALGIKESARAEATADANRLPSSNDAILRGLGAAQGPPPVPNGEDVKPTIVQADEADYYDQYYASLAAGEQTPGMNGFAEEEDVKPSVEYLDSLNEYRKRSRSRDDVGTGGSTPKMPRTDEPAGMVEAETSLYTNGIEVDAAPANGAVNGDDPLVYVNGQPIPLSQVTEEHQEAMTPEEYTAYYEVLSAQA
ncbi:TFIIE alpha subunit-domain-containing protein [Trametes polyzona]|nr:TFIIE alpha subunit-domain-containing protein [Trametes polyzona]